MPEVDAELLLDIVRRLAQVDPLDHDEGECPFCLAMDPARMADHGVECAWRMARDLLGFVDEEPPPMPEATIAAITPANGRMVAAAAVYPFVEQFVWVRGHACPGVRVDTLSEDDRLIDETTGELLVVRARTKGILQVENASQESSEVRLRANTIVPVPLGTLERIAERAAAKGT